MTTPGTNKAAVPRPRLPDDVVELSMLILPFMIGPEFGRCKCAKPLEVGDVVRLLILRSGCPHLRKRPEDTDRLRDLEHALDQLWGSE